MKLTELNPRWSKDKDALMFDCPNKREVTVDIPVSGLGEGANWKVVGDDFATLSITPSIWIRWRHDDPGCHFFVTNGEILIC